MARRDTDDDAPWLAEAELSPRRGSARETTRVSRRSMFWTLFVLLALAAIAVIGVIVLIAKKDSGSTQGYMNAENAPLIAAETGPYKVLPTDPKGLEVTGQDQTLYATGEGADQGSVIDQSAMPETPMARPGTAAPDAAAAPVAPGAPKDLVPEAVTSALPTPALPAPPATATTPPAAPKAAAAPVKPPVAKPVPVKPEARKPDIVKLDPPKPVKPDAAKPDTVVAAAPKPSGSAHTVQLGAFSSPEKAENAWAALVARNGGMSGFNHRLVKIEKGDTTLYRLRASGGDAAALCARLKSGGDACTVVE